MMSIRSRDQFNTMIYGLHGDLLPEANVLVSINRSADRSNTPVRKSVVISIALAAASREAIDQLVVSRRSAG